MKIKEIAYHPEKKILPVIDYLKKNVGAKKEKHNYFDFRKTFLLSLCILKKPKFDLSASLQITKMTLVKDTPYKRRVIKESGKGSENKISFFSQIFSKINFNFFFEEKIEKNLEIEQKTIFPPQKGLRIIILSEILKYLPAKDTLNCSLVSKEWLYISRNDSIWKSHYLRDFKKQKYFQTINIFIPELPPLNENLPAFLQYYNYLDNILQCRSIKYDRRNVRICGVKNFFFFYFYFYYYFFFFF